MVRQSEVELFESCWRQLDYNHATGILFWRKDKTNAGWKDIDGRIHIRLSGNLYLAHRLVFLMFNNYLPELVDHKDQDPSNNLVANLRDATKQVNAINTGLPSNNKSGIKGVSWHKAGSKWTAQIKHDGRKIHLGSYDSLLDATEARLKAEEELWSDLR